MNSKEQFPIFNTYPNLVFLDNASTTQKPNVVINALTDFYTKYNANVHRGLYTLSEKSTELYEEARIKIAKFINADPEEIIFTSGTTDGVNAIAESLKRSKMISDDPKIILSELEHHSNMLPWQRIGEEIFYIPVETDDTKITRNNSQWMDGSNKFKVSAREHYYPIENPFDIVALTHISNVTGGITDVKLISQNARYHNNKNCFVILDMAQSIGHTKIDVKELAVDFAVFSGHKMYGPMGIGVIYAKKALLDKMEPFKVGGGMISEVTRKSATWAKIPSKFEAGTPSVADAYALGVAVDFIQNIGFDFIEKHEADLREYLVTKLKTIDNIKIYHPDLSEKAGAVVSISFDKAHPHDIAQYLGDNNICVRAGHHCTQILHREVFKIPASLRISLGIYNSKEDIDILVPKLKEAIKIYSKI